MISKVQASIRGRKNKAAGDAFETWIDQQHQMAGRLGILAHVVHNQANTKVVGGKLIYTSSGVSDYSGVLIGGDYLAVEAKSVAGTRLNKSAIQPAQQAHLTAVKNAGGLALLLVEFRKSMNRYALLWNEIPWKVLRSAWSLEETDIFSRFFITTGTCYLSKYHTGSDKRFMSSYLHVYPRE